MTPRARETFPAGTRLTGDRIDDSIARVIASWRLTRPELPVESIAVIARLARVQAELAPRLEAVFSRFGIRSGDFAVLATLTRLGDKRLSQRRLCVELGLSAGTVSLRIDRLIRKGLVQREPDPADGRGALISLTDDAGQLFEACAPEHLANSHALLAGLTDREQTQLGDLLSKLLYSLEQRDPNDSVERELGLETEGAPIAAQRRRAVGLPPLTGLLVRHVDPAGPAAGSGIRAGDLLRSANRRQLRNRHDLRLALRRANGPGVLALEIVRGTTAIQLQLQAPASARTPEVLGRTDEAFGDVRNRVGMD